MLNIILIRMSDIFAIINGIDVTELRMKYVSSFFSKARSFFLHLFFRTPGRLLSCLICLFFAEFSCFLCCNLDRGIYWCFTQSNFPVEVLYANVLLYKNSGGSETIIIVFIIFILKNCSTTHKIAGLLFNFRIISVSKLHQSNTQSTFYAFSHAHFSNKEMISPLLFILFVLKQISIPRQKPPRCHQAGCGSAISLYGITSSNSYLMFPF